jgi:septal ring factor EnvC (AmiA/AmiB activator)
MLDLLPQFVGPGESVTLTYTRTKKDEVSLVVQSTLGDNAESVTDTDALKARAALLRPLVLKGSHTDVLDALSQHIRGGRDSRESLRDAYHALAGTQAKEAADAAAAAAKRRQENSRAEAAEAGSDSDKAVSHVDSDTPKAAPAPQVATNDRAMF